MRILLVFDRTRILENANCQTETISFGFGSFDCQPKSPIAVRPASQFFWGIYRSSLPFAHKAFDLGAHGPGRL